MWSALMLLELMVQSPNAEAPGRHGEEPIAPKHSISSVFKAREIADEAETYLHFVGHIG